MFLQPNLPGPNKYTQLVLALSVLAAAAAAICCCAQVCTEFLGQEQPYFPASSSSMFWDQGPFDWEAILQHCRAAWGVQPSKTWMVQQHGGLDWRCGACGTYCSQDCSCSQSCIPDAVYCAALALLAQSCCG
jgi:hypothetical protein